MAQGAPSPGLLIVRRGRLTSSLVEPDGTRTRLQGTGEFTIVGDIGLAAGLPRLAEITTDGIVEGWWLSTDRYQELRTTKPLLMFELHEFVAQIQAERMTSLSQSLANTQR